MDTTYEKIMDIIAIEMHEKEMCAKKCLWLMKRTLNPIRKLDFYLSAKKFEAHVFGIRLIVQKLEKEMGASE